MRRFHQRITEIELRVDLQMLKVVQEKFESTSFERENIEIFLHLLGEATKFPEIDRVGLQKRVAIFLGELFEKYSSDTFSEHYRKHLIIRELFDDFSNPEKLPRAVEYFSLLEQKFYCLDSQYKEIQWELFRKSKNVFFSQEKSSALQRRMDLKLEFAEEQLAKQIESIMIFSELCDITPSSLYSFLEESRVVLSELDDSFRFVFVSPRQIPCQLKKLNLEIAEIAEKLFWEPHHSNDKECTLSEQIFIANMQFIFKNESTHWHIEELLKLQRCLFPKEKKKGANPLLQAMSYKPLHDPMAYPYFHELARRICLLAGNADSVILDKDNLEITLETFIGDYYSIEIFNAPYLVAIRSFLDAEDLIEKMELQLEKLKNLNESIINAIENAKRQLEICQKKERRYQEIQAIIAANNKAIACINGIHKLQKDFLDYFSQVLISNAEMRHFSFSPEAYFVSTDFPFSDKIRFQLENQQKLFQKLTDEIFILNEKIDAHNIAVQTLAKIREECKNLEEHYSCLIELSKKREGILREVLLQKIEDLEFEICRTDIRRDVSAVCILNSDLAKLLPVEQDVLLQKHKQSNEIIQSSLKAIDTAIHRCVIKKIEYLKNQIATIECVMEKRSFHRNQIAQRDLQEVKDFLKNACQKYQEITEGVATNSQAIKNKITELTQQDKEIENFLQEKCNLYQNSHYAAGVGRILYEEAWGLVKRIILTILRRYAKMEHLPRRVKTKTLLQETSRYVCSPDQRLPETSMVPFLQL